MKTTKIIHITAALSFCIITGAAREARTLGGAYTGRSFGSGTGRESSSGSTRFGAQGSSAGVQAPAGTARTYTPAPPAPPKISTPAPAAPQRSTARFGAAAETGTARTYTPAPPAPPKISTPAPAAPQRSTARFGAAAEAPRLQTKPEIPAPRTPVVSRPQAKPESPAFSRAAPSATIKSPSAFGRDGSTATIKPPPAFSGKPATVNPLVSSAKKPLSSAAPAPEFSKPAPPVSLSRPSPRFSSAALSNPPAKKPATFGGTTALAGKKPLPSLRSPETPARSEPKFAGSGYNPDSFLRTRKPAVSSYGYSGGSHYRHPARYDRHRHSSYSSYNVHHHHYYNYNRYACAPVWWGPVAYPAGLGFTWWNSNFAISFSTYGPVHYSHYTPYYNSWYYGGYGYSSVYYGGWRSGWYGGLSYVFNPWPVYRTYYLYEPEPIVIRQPVIVQQQVIVREASPTVAATTAVRAAPVSYAAAGYPPGHIVVEERTTIRAGGENFSAAGFDPEYVYEDQFDPFYYDGDSLDIEFQIGFASYAASLNPESIWISYSGLDRVW